MIRVFIFLIFVYNIQCLSDFEGKTSDEHSPYDRSNSNEKAHECEIPSKDCSELSFRCVNCSNYTTNCIYGEDFLISCETIAGAQCQGSRNFTRMAKCQYCYQTEKWEHTCILKHNCVSVNSPPQYYKTNCTVHEHIFCLGNREFPKKLQCNWTRGHKWSTALILSITLGGFGADRFYLGHWQEGIGKLFSFGGLGVWTLVDVLLISIRYLGPADGSFYV